MLKSSFFKNFMEHDNFSVTVVDVSQKEQPLVYVNQAFCELTQYSQDEVLGKNCRFLQGEKTCKESVKTISHSVEQRKAVFCDLLNYRKDGSEFYNRLILLPIKLEEQQYYIGLQTCSDKLKKSFEQNKESAKGSAEIKDIVNNSLMKLCTFASPKYTLSDDQRAAKVFAELSFIRATVINI